MKHERATAALATIAGMMVVATFVAGKAARDATLLATVPVTSLPLYVGIAAVLTFPLVFLTSRQIGRVGPARLMPILSAGSAALLLAEWLSIARWPWFAAAAVYFHLAAVGPVLVSGFWSTISERFEPRAAKRRIGGIGLGATLGGVGGGLIAERTAELASPTAILLILAALQLACAVVLFVLGRGIRHTRSQDASRPWAAIRVIGRSSLLREIAILVVLSAMGAAALDYVFKADLMRGSGSAPLRPLAIYHTITNVLTALVQLLITGRLVRRLGAPRSVVVLPATVVGFSALSFVVPTAPISMLTRSSEMIVRSSVYRAAYELLFTPLAAADKRLAKVLLDVGADRLGDLLGAQLVAALLFAAPAPRGAILIAAAVIGSLAIVVALDLRRTYTRTLEQRLIDGAPPPAKPWSSLPEGFGEAGDPTSLSLLGIRGEDDATPAPVSAPASPAGAVLPVPAVPAPGDLRDHTVIELAELRSGNAVRIQRVLAAPLAADLASHVVPLLAWDPVAELAREALQAIAPQITGQLVDALLDRDREFSIRRRLPEILRRGEPELASWGLWRALHDPRFEVRYRSGKALAKLRDAGHALGLTQADVFEAVQREVTVDGRLWHSHRLLDQVDGDDDEAVLHRVLEQRSATGLDHVFTLLGLTLPAEPLRLALQAVSTLDPALRGTALEYLESVLPEQVRVPLWPFLEVDHASAAHSRSPDEIVASLKMSHPSIIADLRAQRGTPETHGELIARADLASMTTKPHLPGSPGERDSASVNARERRR